MNDFPFTWGWVGLTVIGFFVGRWCGRQRAGWRFFAAWLLFLVVYGIAATRLLLESAP